MNKRLTRQPWRLDLKMLFLILLTSLLIACGGSNALKKPAAKTYVVHKETIHKVLFFTGTIQPLQEHTVTTPMDAIVETMHYHYGQAVKKGQVIFTLNSAELQKQYNDTLTDYLKAKDSFSIAQA